MAKTEESQCVLCNKNTTKQCEKCKIIISDGDVKTDVTHLNAEKVYDNNTLTMIGGD